ncbi:MAG: hypothetical protein GY854_31065 [Deltaproteobacteria bacterium]|nr:hypothetical protein [Deltaproteobacteria bacterium]
MIDEIPDELLPLFRLLDQLFSETFGKRHDMPLARTISGTSRPMPPSKDEFTYLHIIQQDGKVTELPVTGRKERTFDAFSVLRFLARVIGDR